MSARAEPGARAAASESAEGLSEKSEALLAEHGLHQPSAAVLVQQDFSNWLFFLSCQVMCR